MTKILEVNNLQISFDTYAGKVRAIRGVDFELN
ncbi:MAG: ABC transporter ATP-binding protein, partial [Enterococcus sp.]|nr:ABC transporter ATP-binding protein [Enterococcus sp.]